MQKKSSALLIFTLVVAMPQFLCAQTQERLNRMRTINPALPMPISIDEPLIESLGIRTSSSRHLTLFSDINGRDDIDELPKIFDLAVDGWCDYFNIEKSKTDAWHLRGMVIADRKKFKKAKLIPNELPEFPAGFQRGHEMWVYLQPGNYYTRHLLIHEGTHSFMQWFLGGTGAPWYTEGMAEMLGVHLWKDGKLKINFHLKDRKQAEYWGRIKLIHKDLKQGIMRSLDDVFNIQATSFREVRFYAWSWAACEFLSNHSKSRAAFANLKNTADQSPERFNQAFINSLRDSLPQLERDWQLFIHEIDFGYDARAATVNKSRVSNNDLAVFDIQSNLSWQATNITVERGEQFAISSMGRYLIAKRNEMPWPCEPGGITIEYYRGNPLGQLMVGVLGTDGNIAGLKNPIAVGLNRNIEFTHSGILCLRVNESPTQLFDNEGTLKVEIKKHE